MNKIHKTKNQRRIIPRPSDSKTWDQDEDLKEEAEETLIIPRVRTNT